MTEKQRPLGASGVDHVCGACGHGWRAVARADARRLVECPSCGVTRGRVVIDPGDDLDVAVELVTQAADLLGWDLMFHESDDDHVDGIVVGMEHYLDLVNASVAAVEAKRVV